jgi:hypothetical protein
MLPQFTKRELHRHHLNAMKPLQNKRSSLFRESDLCNCRVKWETMKFLKEPVTTDRIRLNIKQAKKFVIAEFELFPPVK